MPRGRAAAYPAPTVPAHGPRVTARSRPSAAAARGTVAGEARTCADQESLRFARGAWSQAAHRRGGGGAAQRLQPPARAGFEPHCRCGAAPRGPAPSRRDAAGVSRPPASHLPLPGPAALATGWLRVSTLALSSRDPRRLTLATLAGSRQPFWVAVPSGSTRPCGLMSSLKYL